jgi:hypothetical protein
MIVLLPTYTEIIVQGNSNLSIKTSYLETNPPTVIQARISDNVGIQDNVSFIENQLLIQIFNLTNEISFLIDDNGDLIVINNTGSGSYSINGNGDLIFTP